MIRVKLYNPSTKFFDFINIAWQHTAGYSFIKFLEERYGDEVVVNILKYLGSGMISNHRCDTLENCAVYDASRLDMDNKRYELNFNAIVNDWKEFLIGSAAS